MILVVPGISNYSPIREILRGVPYHLCDLIVGEPEKGHEINKELVKNSISTYNVKLLLGKSYGSWVIAEGINEKIPTFLFSPPLKDENSVFGFPKSENKELNFIFGSEDPHFDLEIWNKNKREYKSNLILKGDHSLKPITLDKIDKIKKFIFNSSNVKNFEDFLKDYSKKKKNARVKIIKKTDFYEEIPLEILKNKIDPDLLFALDANYGPITNIVKRKSLGKVFVYQSNILDISKINPLMKDSAATGGIGVSFQEKESINKSIFEALERYSLTLSMADFVNKKFEEIPQFLKIDEKELCFYDKNQMREKSLINPLKENIQWTVIRNILDEAEKLYPLQLIAPNEMSYKIKETSSSGAALGKTKEQALEHGLKEAIERNSLMMWFYNLSGVKSQKISLSKNVPKEFAEIYNNLSEKNFKFDAYLIEFLGFYTIFIMAHNENELYLGSCCGEFKEALSGALNEVIITSFFAKTLKKITPKNIEEIKNLPQHLLYYQDNKKIKLIEYLDSLSKDKFKIEENNFNYLDASKSLKKNGYNVYYKDITAPELRGNDFFVGKVIVFGFLDLIKDQSLSWKGYYKINRIPELPTPFA